MAEDSVAEVVAGEVTVVGVAVTTEEGVTEANSAAVNLAEWAEVAEVAKTAVVVTEEVKVAAVKVAGTEEKMAEAGLAAVKVEVKEVEVMVVNLVEENMGAEEGSEAEAGEKAEAVDVEEMVVEKAETEVEYCTMVGWKEDLEEVDLEVGMRERVEEKGGVEGLKGAKGAVEEEKRHQNYK